VGEHYVRNAQSIEHGEPAFGHEKSLALQTRDSHATSDLHDAFGFPLRLSDFEFDHVHACKLRRIPGAVNEILVTSFILLKSHVHCAALQGSLHA